MSRLSAACIRLGAAGFSQVGSAYVVVVDIDRLGRDAPEVMTRIRDPGVRGIVLRSRREGIDTSNATGRREGTGQTKAVASKTQLVSAVAKFSKWCGGAKLVRLAMSQ
jgi:DNA invertase Pin-like site-specific DNA recombinase